MNTLRLESDLENAQTEILNLLREEYEKPSRDHKLEQMLERVDSKITSIFLDIGVAKSYLAKKAKRK